jgi:hypothetical protein
MGDNIQNLASVYSITSEAASLVPGAMIPITISGSDPFTGFLLYAVGSDPAARVGLFDAIDGAKAAEGCGEFNLDAPESVLTHSSPGALNSPTFMYTVPENAGSISFNAIVVQKIETGGFAWGILKDALTLDAAEYSCTPGVTCCNAAETVVVTEYVMVEQCRSGRKEIKCRRKESKSVPTQAFGY